MSTVLHVIAQANDVERLRLALVAGSDVHARARPLQTTPLHLAARYGAVECAALLLDSGAAVDAQSHFGSTPLYDACDYKQEQAAKLLIARGASANVHGDRGRTPLHVAIKRGLVDVVRAMLDAGAADPSVRTRRGDNDTLSFVKKSAASKSERAWLAALLPQYESLESAVASGNADAIEAVVKRAFATNDMSVAIATFVRAAPHHATRLDAYRLRLLSATIQMNRPDLFQTVLRVGQAATTELREMLLSARFEGEAVRTTALHLAAFYGHTQFIEFLVDDGDMDPEIRDALQRRAIDLVTDAKDPTGAVRSLLMRLTRQRRFQRFTTQLLSCTAMSGGELIDTNGTLLASQLERLSQTLSSVRDVRVLFQLGTSTLASNALQRVLACAFTQLLEDKLVVDDREALVFKLVLRECERRGIFSPLELEHWDLQLVKVNMESAPWAKDLKHSLRQLEWRAEDLEIQSSALRQHVDALEHAIQTAQNSGVFVRAIARVRNVLSLLSVVLALAGVDGASDAIDTVVDLSEPLSVLAATYTVTAADQLRAFVDDPRAASLVVRDELAPAFERAGVDPTRLAEMLRDVVLLEREQQGATTSTGSPAIKDPTEAAQKRAVAKEQEESPSDLEQFPFHYAVQHCAGDLSAFLDLVAFVDDDSTKYAQAVVVVAPPQKKTHEKTKTVHATPAVLASHLGYVTIAKYFLDQDDYPRSADGEEKRFVTLQRAHLKQKQRQRAIATAA